MNAVTDTHSVLEITDKFMTHFHCKFRITNN